MEINWQKDAAGWRTSFFHEGFAIEAVIVTSVPKVLGELHSRAVDGATQVAHGVWFVPAQTLAVRAQAFHDQVGLLAHRAVQAARQSILDDGLKLVDLQKGRAAGYSVTVTARRGRLSATVSEDMTVRTIGLRGPQPHFASQAIALARIAAKELAAQIVQLPSKQKPAAPFLRRVA